MRNKCLKVLASVIALAAAVSRPADAQFYQVIDLGSLGGAESAARAINKTGRIVGTSQDPAGYPRAFRTGLYLPINTATDKLGDLGGAEVRGYAINDAGNAAGAAMDPYGDWHAYLYNGAMVDLGTLGGQHSMAFGINTTGKIVGESQNASGDIHAFLYNAGVRTDLGTLGGANSRANGIGDGGKIVGGAENALGDLIAFRTAAYAAINAATDGLGTLGGASSEAFAINFTDVIVGRAQTGTGEWNAFRHTGGVMSSLGTLGGLNSAAYGINKGGKIVGSSEDASGDPHAFYWSSGVMTDLNSLIGASPWTLVSATGINETGFIVGTGLLDGDMRAFLLKPIQVKTLVLAPSTLAGGLPATGTVTLTFPTPADTIVTLSETHPNATVPATMTVLAGATTGTFVVTTTAVAANTAGVIQASYGGVAKPATLTLTPVSVKTLTFLPTSLYGSLTTTGTITLEAPAGPGDITVALTSSNAALAAPPASVTIPAGSTTGTFSVATAPVTVTTVVSITATANGRFKAANITLTPISVKTLAFSSATPIGCLPSTGTVTLESAAGTGGLTVTLSSANPALASVPASITIPAGALTGTFTVTTSAVAANTVVAITATANARFKTASITLKPIPPKSVTLSPTTVVGGNPSTGTVTLECAAGPGNITVTLASSITTAATVPASVIVPMGATSVTFPITTYKVTAAAKPVIKATAALVAKTATLTVNK